MHHTIRTIEFPKIALFFLQRENQQQRNNRRFFFFFSFFLWSNSRNDQHYLLDLVPAFIANNYTVYDSSCSEETKICTIHWMCAHVHVNVCVHVSISWSWDRRSLRAFTWESQELNRISCVIQMIMVNCIDIDSVYDTEDYANF